MERCPFASLHYFSIIKNKQRAQILLIVVVLLMLAICGPETVSEFGGNTNKLRLLKALEKPEMVRGQMLESMAASYDSRDLFEVGIIRSYLGRFDSIGVILNDESLSDSRKELLRWLVIQSLISRGEMELAKDIYLGLNSETSEVLNEQILLTAKNSDRSGDFVTTEKMLLASIIFVPNDLQRYERLSDYYLRHGKTESSITSLLEGNQGLNEATSAYLAGRVSEKQGRWKESASYYKKAVDLGIDDVLAHYRLAFVLGIRMRSPNAGIPICVEAANRFPESYACYELLGLLYEQIGDLDAAARWYRLGLKNIERQSYRSIYWRGLGDIFLSQQKDMEAINYYQQAIQEHPTYVPAHLGLARVYMNQADTESAIEHYELSIRLRDAQKGHVPDTWFVELGAAYETYGDIENARSAYSKAKQIKPDNTDAVMGLERIQGY